MIDQIGEVLMTDLYNSLMSFFYPKNRITLIQDLNSLYINITMVQLISIYLHIKRQIQLHVHNFIDLFMSMKYLHKKMKNSKVHDPLLLKVH